MFSKTTLALAVAIALGTAFPALAAIKHQMGGDELHSTPRLIFA